MCNNVIPNQRIKYKSGGFASYSPQARPHGFTDASKARRPRKGSERGGKSAIRPEDRYFLRIFIIIYYFFRFFISKYLILLTVRDAHAAFPASRVPTAFRTTKRLSVMKKLLALLFLAFALAWSLPASAQEFSFGADIVSRYVWRGVDFGESASVQPALTFSRGGLEIGAWASYATNPGSADANEHDLWIGYSAGAFSVGITDYYFPNATHDEHEHDHDEHEDEETIGFFDFSGDGEGAHVLEPYFSFNGTESFPVTLYVAYNAHNDPDNSLYLNASVPFTAGDVEMSFGIGASAGKSGWYGADGFSIIDMALGASKSIPITDKFELPVSVSYILNPTTEKSFLVFGISL